MANDSVSIAISEALEYLQRLGGEALYSPDEIEKIIRASFLTLRATEDEKKILDRGIQGLIERAAGRASGTGE